jgi:hypothetical protein
MTLHNKGFRVMTMPEIPTLLMINGARFPGIDGPRDKLLTYETNLLKLQLSMEDSFKNIAGLNDEPTVVIYDRGALDVAAYMPRDLWLETLMSIGITEVDLLKRYDIVCHLVTAADGAEAFYTTINNTVRKETPQEARDLDRRTLSCWADHPRLKIATNAMSDFDTKLNFISDFVVEEVESIINKDM